MKIDDISRIVCDFHKLDFSELIERNRKREVLQARQQAIYFSKIYSKKSLADISNYYGGRDHATALHNVRTAKNLIQTDKQYANECMRIDNIIKEFIKPKVKSNVLLVKQKYSQYCRQGLKR